jgi:hypothetical protein
MKKYIILLFVLMTATSFSQALFHKNGVDVSYDTTYSAAGGNLTVPVSTVLKYVGEIDLRLPNAFQIADSVALEASFSDSIRIAFYFIAKSKWDATPAIGDTVAAVLPAATATFYHVQNGAGHVMIPWYKLKAALTGLTDHFQKYNVYVRIEKIAGLFSYGKTTGETKTPGKVNIKPHLYY